MHWQPILVDITSARASALPTPSERGHFQLIALIRDATERSHCPRTILITPGRYCYRACPMKLQSTTNETLVFPIASSLLQSALLQSVLHSFIAGQQSSHLREAEKIKVQMQACLYTDAGIHQYKCIQTHTQTLECCNKNDGNIHPDLRIRYHKNIHISTQTLEYAKTNAYTHTHRPSNTSLQVHTHAHEDPRIR